MINIHIDTTNAKPCQKFEFSRKYPAILYLRLKH